MYPRQQRSSAHLHITVVYAIIYKEFGVEPKIVFMRSDREGCYGVACSAGSRVRIRSTVAPLADDWGCGYSGKRA